MQFSMSASSAITMTLSCNTIKYRQKMHRKTEDGADCDFYDCTVRQISVLQKNCRVASGRSFHISGLGVKTTAVKTTAGAWPAWGHDFSTKSFCFVLVYCAFRTYCYTPAWPFEPCRSTIVLAHPAFQFLWADFAASFKWLRISVHKSGSKRRLIVDAQCRRWSTAYV